MSTSSRPKGRAPWPSCRLVSSLRLSVGPSSGLRPTGQTWVTRPGASIRWERRSVGAEQSVRGGPGNRLRDLPDPIQPVKPSSYIGLLRAVNVGGRNLVAMADLRDLLADLKLANPRTLLQSGN